MNRYQPVCTMYLALQCDAVQCTVYSVHSTCYITSQNGSTSIDYFINVYIINNVHILVNSYTPISYVLLYCSLYIGLQPIGYSL